MKVELSAEVQLLSAGPLITTSSNVEATVIDSYFSTNVDIDTADGRED